VRKLRVLLWLNLLRMRRNALATIAGSLTDALWALAVLAGALVSGAPAREVFWALIAWILVVNVTWMLGGWLDYLASLGLVEEHLIRGVALSRLLLCRALTTFISAGFSSLLTYIGAQLLLRDALTPASIPHAVLALLALALHSLAYGGALAALSLTVLIPSYLLDFISFAFLGILLLPLPPDQVEKLAWLPIVGPAYLLKASAAAPPPLTALAASAALAAPLLALALALIKLASARIEKRGVKVTSAI